MCVQQAQKRNRFFEAEILNIEREQLADFSFKLSSDLFTVCTAKTRQIFCTCYTRTPLLAYTVKILL